MGSHGLKLHGYLHDVRTRGEEMFIRRRPAHFKGNVAAYKDLNLVTVTIKRYFSREHSERM